MENFVYYFLGCGVFSWFVGWLLACGVHYRSVVIINKYGTDEDRISADDAIPILYVYLVFLWPIYLKRISE